MRFVEVVLTTAILVAATASILARDDVSGGIAAQGPGGAVQQLPDPPRDIYFSSGEPAEDAGGGRIASLQETADATRLREAAPDAETATRHEPRRAEETIPNAGLRSPPAAPRLALGPVREGSSTGSEKPPAWFDFKANKALSTMVGGLAIAVGVFLLFAWAVRKRMPKGSARLPDEIIEVLGRTSLAAKQSLHLVRVGGKLIVVSVTAAGTETLTEITDPGEVARILAACQQHHIHSSSTAFRQVFEQLGREPASGFLSAQSGRTHFSREGTGAA